MTVREIIPAAADRPPSLEPGDHLTRQEFERRYAATPHVKKAELIEGVVHMPSPVRWNRHGEQHGWVMTWLGVYKAATPGVRAADNATVGLDADNVFQPDVAMMSEGSGNAKLDADGYAQGAPELIAEIAASTVSIDSHEKLRVYRRNGVREYIIWRVADGAIDWLALRGMQYVLLPKDAQGVYRSVIFPGLWLDEPAMLRGDLARVLEVLRQGLESAEHAAFMSGQKPAGK